MAFCCFCIRLFSALRSLSNLFLSLRDNSTGRMTSSSSSKSSHSSSDSNAVSSLSIFSKSSHSSSSSTAWLPLGSNCGGDGFGWLSISLFNADCNATRASALFSSAESAFVSVSEATSVTRFRKRSNNPIVSLNHPVLIHYQTGQCAVEGGEVFLE